LLQREAAPAAEAELPQDWGEALVADVLRDLESSALPEKEKALLRFVDRVNYQSPQITPADMQPLYQAGWTDEAIYYAITVCALFNFYNRWIDASGVHALSDETHRQGGVRSANAGYVRK
jgi:alkylhydroperoxidase family enzyme